MSAETIQSLNILQMSKLELIEYIRNELIENPVLEEVGSNVEGVSTEAMEEQLENVRDDFDKFDAYDLFDTNSGSYGESFEYEKFTARGETLDEHLTGQLYALKLDDETKEICEYLIGSIDDDGYIKTSKPELALECKSRFGCDSAKVERALEIVQSMDPVGIGSLCIEDCLVMQVEFLCKNPYSLLARKYSSVETLRQVLCMLVREMLPDIADNRIAAIAKKLGIGKSEAQELVDIIRGLEPKPGRRFSDGNPVSYVVPDVIVEVDDDKYSLKLNNRDIPKVAVSPYYKSLMDGSYDGSEESKKEIKNFLGSRINSAEQLLSSIKQRGDTIARITEAIVKRQSQFFEPGVKMLKPLTLQMIAEDTGLHISTVSRTVNGKYLHCAGNTYSLQYFFGSGIVQNNVEVTMDENGVFEEYTAVSASDIKNRIRKIIENEDKLHPLSDAKIEFALKNEGVEVSRRTIAKYRDELGILAASKRKRF